MLLYSYCYFTALYYIDIFVIVFFFLVVMDTSDKLKINTVIITNRA